ncbi:tail fiber protein [Roseivirga sp.]|uniref:tail fiber protein n=1 Tax=Roseivirga sp. TaxID=1964215 RepID=UPI003B8BD6B3
MNFRSAVLGLIPLFFILNSFAQTNLGFDFQGYARDPNGSALSNQSLKIRFEIFRDGESNAEYQEEHQSVSTDAFGVFAVEIGSNPDNNASGDWDNILWANYDYRLKISVDLDGTYREISDKRLSSVPFAKSAGNGVPPGTIIPFAGPASNIPLGYVLCDGGGYSTSDARYLRLFETIGTNWGGNGGQFNVPDLRGQFLRGWNGVNNGGADPNTAQRTTLDGLTVLANQVGSYQSDTLRSHNHGINESSHSHTYEDAVYITDSKFLTNASASSFEFDTRATRDNLLGSGSADENNSIYRYKNAPSTSGAKTNITISTNGGPESRPKNAAVLYIIKL